MRDIDLTYRRWVYCFIYLDKSKNLHRKPQLECTGMYKSYKTANWFVKAMIKFSQSLVELIWQDTENWVTLSL